MLDRHEADAKFQKNLTQVYGELARKKALARWVTIDGEKSEEEVFKEIKKAVK
jgi:thymidylate kinase